MVTHWYSNHILAKRSGENEDASMSGVRQDKRPSGLAGPSVAVHDLPDGGPIMAASPQYKVYDQSGEYVAAVKEVAPAAILVAWYGDGATIRAGHRVIVWTEGAESQSAAESYDYVSNLVGRRLVERVRR